VPAGYRLADGPPTAEAYLELRLRFGLTPKSEAEATAAFAGKLGGLPCRPRESAPGRRLYARYGFVETAPRSLGMMMTLE
jgi:hypothetical protein